MKKMIFTAALISTLFSCTTDNSINTSKDLAIAEYRMELPTAPEQVGFENILLDNVNFTYLAGETNALAVVDNLKRDKAYTLLAPVDYAFAKAKKPEAFMLANYIIEGEWSKEAISKHLESNASLTVETLSGMELNITQEVDKFIVSNAERQVEIIFTDLDTESNTMHVISELW